MSEHAPILERKAAALAEAFDRSFAEARAWAPTARRDYLAVRLGGDPYAIPLSGLAELTALGRITQLPGADGACLGLTALRGITAPVFDLGVLLGYPAARRDPRWLATLAAANAALAFDAIDRHLRVPAPEPTEPSPGAPDRLLSGSVQAGGEIRPIVDLAAVLAWIRRQAHRPGAAFED